MLFRVHAVILKHVAFLHLYAIYIYQELVIIHYRVCCLKPKQLYPIIANLYFPETLFIAF